MKKRIVSVLLVLAMLLGLMPGAVYAENYENEYEDAYKEVPIPVTTEGKTYSLFTEENLEDQDGTTFLYVIKRGDRYYTPAHPGAVGDYKEMRSVAAVDITQYWNAQTNTFSGIPDSANVGVLQYQMYPFPTAAGDSALFLDGNIMFSLSVPFEDNGDVWFNGLRYFDREQTYGYSRALWEATGDGKGYFYDRYNDWYGDGATVYGALALDGDNRFALRNFSEAFEAETAIDVNGYLYAAPCGHEAPEHSAYVAPTCMDKGCREYWYCMYCTKYYQDADCRDAYECRPVLPALGHDYSDISCANCQQPIPQYTKITSYEQFQTIKPGASFIAVAEIDDGNGGKEYYVLKEPKNIVNADIDENGCADILDIDENDDGTPDVLETDSDGDGIADVFAMDGFFDEPDGKLDDMEIEQYLFELEQEYTDGYMVDARTLAGVKVTPRDGIIDVKGLDALEFVMERVIPDELLEEQYYGDGATVKDYENDFIFRIPNFWVRPMVTLDNNRYQQPYEQGDSKCWGVLFGKDAREVNDLYFDETYPNDAAVIYTESFHSMNSDGELEHALRFLVNGEDKCFIITSYYYWEEIQGTQIPIYLYSSDAGEGVHQHVWGPWNPHSEDVHKRVCTVSGCDAFDFAGHTYGTDYAPDTENYELGHWVTCTVCSGKVHEYHTWERVGRNDYWQDTNDGKLHVVNCTKCKGPASYQEHRWTDWWLETNVNGESRHVRRCSVYACYRYEYKAATEHIYDSRVTTQPTCTEPGIRTYTCTADDCSNSYTEEIPALDHDWGQWSPSASDTTKEERVCNRDPSHKEERLAHTCEFGDWVDDQVSETHSRQCTVPGCTNRQTEKHNWDNGIQTAAPTCTEAGEVRYTCPDCQATKNSSIDAIGHDWTDWIYDSVDSHIRTCKRNCGVNEEFEGHQWGRWTAVDDSTHKLTCEICSGYQSGEHDWDNGVVTQEPTCKAAGVKTYTCQTCQHTKTEELPALAHEFGDWAPNNDGTAHSRSCHCGESESAEHNFDEGSVTERPTHTSTGIKTYTCADCGYAYTEELPMLTEHQWEEWVVNKVDEANTHIRFCICNESQTAPHNFDEGVVTQEPTHTSKGIKTYTCSDCHYDYEEEIPTTPEHTWTNWYPNDNGTHTRACRCNANETQNCVWDEGVVTEQPTHFEEGIKTYTCSVCGNIKTEKVDKLAEHLWSEWWGNNEGITHSRECKCGATETVPHAWGDWTELAAGGYSRECADCGAREWMELDEEKPVNTTTPAGNAANSALGNTDIELIDKVLTDEEQSQVAKGEEVKIYLKVEDISAAAPEEHKTEVEAAVGDDAVGMYLDIELLKQVGTAEETPVTQTAGAVTITITIPEELLSTDESVIRTYKIVRVHEDENGNLITDVIEGVFDPETNTFTFQTDKFSTYALVYADENTAIPGDIDGNGQVNTDDVIRLLLHVSMPETFPISAEADFVKDGVITTDDVIQLLLHVSMPETFPL